MAAIYKIASRFSSDAQSVSTLILYFSIPRMVINTFLLLKPPNLMVFCYCTSEQIKGLTLKHFCAICRFVCDHIAKYLKDLADFKINHIFFFYKKTSVQICWPVLRWQVAVTVLLSNKYFFLKEVPHLSVQGIDDI